MSNIKKQILIGTLLVFLSALVYTIHYFIFRDAHHLFIYLKGDIAFVFLEVLMVTLIIEKILYDREKKKMMKKLNMVIGAFFSEVGTNILKSFAKIDNHIHDNILYFQEHSKPDKFNEFIQKLKENEFIVDIDKMQWDILKKMLSEKRDFMLRLLENPSLLEHDKFTDVLWATFHLTEELESRDSLDGLPKEDYMHLAGDVHRVYSKLSPQWIEYMKHLQTDYPHLFSLALRLNPFNPESSAIVKE
ncbi:MAG: hypothetical protein PF574_06270 [Candidatus Delongbacteria bacterium]|jgi:hypothetical protein|nr:hypothetical protein [Candidatus Delongbacteria bacterium]